MQANQGGKNVKKKEGGGGKHRYRARGNLDWFHVRQPRSRDSRANVNKRKGKKHTSKGKAAHPTEQVFARKSCHLFRKSIVVIKEETGGTISGEGTSYIHRE